MSTIQSGNYLLSALRQQLKPSAEVTVSKPNVTRNTAESRTLLAGLDNSAQKHDADIKSEQLKASPQNMTAVPAQLKGSGVENNSMVLPDIESLSKTDAAGVLKNVQYVIDQGQNVGRAVSGTNGSQKTDSIDVYKSWLQARVGVDVYA